MCEPAEATQWALGRAEWGEEGHLSRSGKEEGTCPARGGRKAAEAAGTSTEQGTPRRLLNFLCEEHRLRRRRASPFSRGETPWPENKSHSPLIKAAAWHIVFEDFGFIQKPHENLVSCFYAFPRAASQELLKSGGRMTADLDSLAALEARSAMAKCRTFPASGGNKLSSALLPASGVWAILGVTVRPGGRPDSLTWSLTAALAS